MSTVEMRLGIVFQSCIVLLFALLVLPACGTKEVASDHAARQAYLGLDGAVDRALRLAMRGYNEAVSANIPDQTEAGDESGSMVVGGKVDAGVSANKVITVTVALEEYSDGALEDEDGEDLFVVYYTDAEGDDLPVLDLKLKNIPNGTFDGTLEGWFSMEGDLEGDVTLKLELAGSLEEIEGSDGEIRREPGTVTVVGTATSRYGEFEVDISL